MPAPKFIGFNANPDRHGLKVANTTLVSLGTLLAIVPFVLIITAYMVGSDIRLTENPSDKLMPSLASMWDSFYEAAFVPDKRKGTYLLWNDWISSMWRLLAGIGLASVVGLFLGLNAGLYPGFRRLSVPFVTFVSIIPPLAILPILLIVFGAGEVGKIALIFFGTVWLITRDIYLYTKAIPFEQIIKGLTLGASQFAVTYRIILPQVLPRLINTIRLNMGPAWLFLIAAEAIAAKAGLGYRIFLVRRYMAMDLIIPYVMVITLTGFIMDFGLRKTLRLLFPWYAATQEQES